MHPVGCYCTDISRLTVRGILNFYKIVKKMSELTQIERNIYLKHEQFVNKNGWHWEYKEFRGKQSPDRGDTFKNAVCILAAKYKLTLTFWRRNYFLILAHSVYKM